MSEPKTDGIVLVTAETVVDKIFVVRGRQVMLDFDLAEIYGYTTSRFNEQVKRNIDKFDEDFRFQLTREELDELVISHFATSRASNYFKGQSGGTRKLPYVFTEQGIYMLMTVLHGELATRQSKALIRLFKQMKDYLVAREGLPGGAVPLSWASQLSENTREIGALRSDLDETRGELARFMANFEQSSFGKEYLILNGQTIEASVAYRQIYSLARETIFIVDNYLGLRTLLNLADAPHDVAVTVFSDNVRRGLSKVDYEDYCKEHPQPSIRFRRTGGKFHDRFIVLDYGKSSERVYVCGSSSKDSGKRVTVIMESEMREMYHQMIEGLLAQPQLDLR